MKADGGYKEAKIFSLALIPAYRIESLKMFDFFPHTEHTEVLAVLTRT